MGVLNLIDLFSLYVLDKLLTLTYSLVTNLDNCSLSLSSESNKLLILSYYILINGIFSALQKLPKYFNGIANSTSCIPFLFTS